MSEILGSLKISLSSLDKLEDTVSCCVSSFSDNVVSSRLSFGLA